MLPGDLFRITAETVGLPLVVRKKFAFSTGFYFVWATTYLGFAYWLLPIHGVLGVALAYLISQALNACFLVTVTSLVLRYRMSSHCLVTLSRGFLLVAAVATYRWLRPDSPAIYLVCFLALATWTLLSARDAAFRRIFVGLKDRLLTT